MSDSVLFGSPEMNIPPIMMVLNLLTIFTASSEFPIEFTRLLTMHV